MLIVTTIVFFLALFFSLTFVVKTIEFIVKAVLAGKAEFQSGLSVVTAMLWAIFYCLVAW